MSVSLCNKIPTTDLSVSVNKVGCYEFEFRNSPYTLFLRSGVYSFELYGASAGYGSPRTPHVTGKGGYVKGLIRLYKRKLYLFIGGKGLDYSILPESAGYNGGAPGVTGPDSEPTGGSGGGTDVRTDKEKIESRIIVAGGGGSTGDWKYGGKGGDGGGIEGIAGVPSSSSCKAPGGEQGTQLTGYKLFQGETGEEGGSNLGEAGGSGGGGYWGGKRGRTGGNSCSGGGGGGGSSFISGHPSCIAVDKDGNSLGTPFHPSGLYFTLPVTETGVNEGNGKAIITLLYTIMISCRRSIHSRSFLHFVLCFFINT